MHNMTQCIRLCGVGLADRIISSVYDNGPLTRNLRVRSAMTSSDWPWHLQYISNKQAEAVFQRLQTTVFCQELTIGGDALDYNVHYSVIILIRSRSRQIEWWYNFWSMTPPSNRQFSPAIWTNQRTRLRPIFKKSYFEHELGIPLLFCGAPCRPKSCFRSPFGKGSIHA